MEISDSATGETSEIKNIEIDNANSGEIIEYDDYSQFVF